MRSFSPVWLLTAIADYSGVTPKWNRKWLSERGSWRPYTGELLHSQKMTALGTLAAGIAHDFNNILSIIKGSAQIIEDNLDNPQKVCTRVDRIKTVVEQGSGIVKAMLGFSRTSDEQPTRSNLNDVVDDTIKLLGDRFLREVEVHFEPSSNLPEVTTSRDFIQQILLNFIFNAVEAMTQRKQVILATRLLDTLPAASGADARASPDLRVHLCAGFRLWHPA